LEALPQFPPIGSMPKTDVSPRGSGFDSRQSIPEKDEMFSFILFALFISLFSNSVCLIITIFGSCLYGVAEIMSLCVQHFSEFEERKIS
jgi:hypothetical protein